ncbi:MFS transporter [Sesbania bispinosa]|nr:MFS transporter [Sesbania bispinosa]
MNDVEDIRSGEVQAMAMDKIFASDAIMDILSNGTQCHGLDGMVGLSNSVGLSDIVSRPNRSDRMMDLQADSISSPEMFETQIHGLGRAVDVNWSKINQEVWSSLHSAAADPSRVGPTTCSVGLGCVMIRKSIAMLIIILGAQHLQGRKGEDHLLMVTLILSGESGFVPITLVEDLAAMGVHFHEPAADAKLCPIKRRRGSPRKNVEKTKIGMKLGVSGVADDSVTIERLADMEKRNCLAIGRPSVLID